MFSGDSIDVVIDNIIFYLSNGDIVGLMSELPVVSVLLLTLILTSTLVFLSRRRGRVSPIRGSQELQKYEKHLASQLASKTNPVTMILCVDSRAETIAHAVAEILKGKGHKRPECRLVPITEGARKPNTARNVRPKPPTIAKEAYNGLVEEIMRKSSKSKERIVVFSENYRMSERVRFVARILETCGVGYHLAFFHISKVDLDREVAHFRRARGDNNKVYYSRYFSPLVYWAVKSAPNKDPEVDFAK